MKTLREILGHHRRASSSSGTATTPTSALYICVCCWFALFFLHFVKITPQNICAYACMIHYNTTIPFPRVIFLLFCKRLKTCFCPDWVSEHFIGHFHVRQKIFHCSQKKLGQRKTTCRRLYCSDIFLIALIFIIVITITIIIDKTATRTAKATPAVAATTTPLLIKSTI